MSRNALHSKLGCDLEQIAVEAETVARDDLTVEKLFSIWDNGSGSPTSPHWWSTRLTYARRLRDTLGLSTSVGTITQEHLWKAQTSLLSQGLAESTVNKITHNIFRAVLRDAREIGVLRTGQHLRLCDVVKRTRRLPEYDNSDYEAWTIKERDIITKRMRDEHIGYLALWLWQISTGTRPGEALGLKWSEVDLKRKWARIRQSRSHGRITPCKSKHSRRELHLATMAVDALKLLDTGTGFIFRSQRNCPIDLGAFRRNIWRKVMDDLEGKVTRRPFYASRHTFASIVLSSDVMGLSELAAYLGHDVTITERHYTRYLNTDTGANLDKALGKFRN